MISKIIKCLIFNRLCNLIGVHAACTGVEDVLVEAALTIDLLWRASLLDHFFGFGMGAEGMREAIIFYDMDRLDAPTIGAFV